LICFDCFGDYAYKFAGSRFDFLATNDRREELRATTRIPDGVEQNTFFTAFKTRDDRMRCGLRDRAGSVPRRNFNRKRISFRWPIQIADFDEPKPGAVVVFGDSRLLNDLQIAKSSCLRTEPAACLKVSGQNFAFDCSALAVSQELFEVYRGANYRHRLLPRRAASIGRRLQGEPIVGMWTQRDDVMGFSNRPKEIAAKNFHRHVTGKARESQFCRLRKAREVYYNQNDFVAVPAKKGENLWVIRVEKFKRTTRKRLKIFPHGNDSPRPPKQ